VTIKAGRARIRIAAGLIAAGFAFLSRTASAEPNRVVVLPTSVGEHLDCTISSPDAKAQDAGWVALARRIDGLVTDAVEDAGMETELRLNVSHGTPEKGGCVEDTELRTLAKRTVVLSPRLMLRDGRMILRIVALSPNSSVLRLVTRRRNSTSGP
jgi:hypothetical protein